jgi:hypothetical protein
MTTISLLNHSRERVKWWKIPPRLVGRQCWFASALIEKPVSYQLYQQNFGDSINYENSKLKVLTHKCFWARPNASSQYTVLGNGSTGPLYVLVKHINQGFSQVSLKVITPGGNYGGVGIRKWSQRVSHAWICHLSQEHHATILST